MFSFDRTQLSDFKGNIHREWAITNGIGGYGGSSVLGAHNRTHQGYLIASLHPPVERYLVFSKTNEKVEQGGVLYDFTTAQHGGKEMAETVVDSSDLPEAYKRKDTVDVAVDFVPREAVYTQGNQFLTEFSYDGTVCFTYEAGEITVKKQIALERGKNLCALAYEITNRGEEAIFTITPLMNFREHSTNATRESLQHLKVQSVSGSGFTLASEEFPDVRICLEASEGELTERKEQYDVDMQLQTEVDNETPGLDTHFTPYDIRTVIPAHGSRKISLICQVCTGENAKFSEVDENAAFSVIEKQKDYFDGLLKKAGYEDPFARALVLASDQFLSYRQSTGLMTVLAGLPWFTDWGRDTMIAFTGLTLATGRFSEAGEILQTFARYVHHGMVPNMFPDDGQSPLYNTADASLWYFYAVDKYLSYVKSEEAYRFIEREIYPALKEIIKAYREGTDFSIYMEEDGLIHAGSGTDQVTWMDVRVGDWVVTPRHGKPVEINALWYNALCVMERLAGRFKEDGGDYKALAEKVKQSFVREFWNEEMGCLYDVVSGEEKDDSLRPNQIYAVALPYTMLPEDKAKAVVEVVAKELYAGCGIRSLARSHKDYHPIYCGSLPKRDAAYHQGTAWGYILGGFITAYLKVHNHSSQALQQAMAYLEPVKGHLWENCIGSICEIFDGDAPHLGRGCYAQAWSVGEVLRCYTEDILPYM